MNEASQFTGRTFLVVGATGGIGSVIASQLAEADASLVVTGRNAKRLASLPGQQIAVDLTDLSSRTELAAKVPSLDGVVFAAGVAPLAPIRYLKDEDLSDCLQLNTTVPLQLLRELLKAKKLINGAAVVFLSSVAARRGTAGYAAYAASKSALEAAARCLAVELAPKSIRVNCVAPGMVESDMANGFAEATTVEVLAEHAKAYPLGLGKPTDVAAAVNFLLSEASRWVTGTTLTVDGGFTL